jgi:hypothetical protein
VPDITISAEEFYELKQRLADVEAQVTRLESHYQDWHAQQMTKLADLANGMKTILEVVDKRFDAIEAVVFKEA